MLVLAVGTLLDMAHPAELNTLPMIFIFFAAGLGGLNIGHLLPESQASARAGTWPRVITGLVSTILLIGLAFSVLQKGLLASVSAPLVALLDAAMKAILWAIIIPLAYALNVFVELLLKLFDRPVEEEPGQAAERVRLLERQIGLRAQAAEEAEEGAGLFYFIVQVVEWVVLALFALLLLYLIYRALRRLWTRAMGPTAGRHESVREDANPASDLARLLLRLIPRWGGKEARQPGFGLPDGPPGVIDVLRIYYELLATAERHGLSRRSHETATEFQEPLEKLFPGDLVRMATEAFNRAIYGHHSASDEEITQMRSSLARTRAALRAAGG